MTNNNDTRVSVKREPLHMQVCKAILTLIRDGTWTVGQTVPNEYRLSTMFNVSIGTVRTAVDHLVSSGVLDRKQGRGTWILNDGSRQIHEKFFSFRFGSSAETIDLEFEQISESLKVPDSYVADFLSLQTNGAAHYILQRARSPFATILLETFFPESMFKDTLEDELGRRVPAMLAIQNGINIGFFEERTVATTLEGEIANHLTVPPETPLLKVERRIWDDSNRPIAIRFAYAHLTGGFHYRKEKCDDIKIFK